MSRRKMSKKGKLAGLLIVILSLSLIGVSAYIYDQASQSVNQTVKEVATVNLKNSALGNLKEGETKFYTKGNVTDLGDAISVETTEVNVYLHLNSNLDTLTAYATYNIVVKFSTVPSGSSHSVGDTACTLSLSSPDYNSVVLDIAGTWKFDFEITTTANSVNSDTATAVTIIVSAESTL